MKKKKFITILLVAMVLMSCIIAGCGKEFTAKESAQIYWEIGCGNTSNISKISMKEEDLKATLEKNKEDAIKQLKTECLAQGLTVTDEQVSKVFDASNELIKKANVNIEEVSNDGKVAKIKYKTNYVDMNKLGTKAANEAIESVKSLGLTNQNEAMNKYSEIFTGNLVNELRNTTFSEDTKEKTYTFTKKDKIWIPEGDSTEFVKNLGELVGGKI